MAVQSCWDRSLVFQMGMRQNFPHSFQRSNVLGSYITSGNLRPKWGNQTANTFSTVVHWLIFEFFAWGTFIDFGCWPCMRSCTVIFFSLVTAVLHQRGHRVWYSSQTVIRNCCDNKSHCLQLYADEDCCWNVGLKHFHKTLNMQRYPLLLCQAP